MHIAADRRTSGRMAVRRDRLAPVRPGDLFCPSVVSDQPVTDLDELARRIGRTPLRAAPRLARAIGAGELFLKLERANPGRAHKDRAALALITAARARGARAVTIGTCGNAGLSLAMVGGRAGLSVHVFVPRAYRSAPVCGLTALGARVERTEGGYEEAVMASAEYARASGAYDANPGGPAGTLAMRAYGAIARELADELPEPPDSVWVSVGNGTTIAGIGRGVLECAAGGRRLPRVCGAGSLGNTAAIATILAGSSVEIPRERIRASEVNEPLLNWRSLHALEALDAVRRTGGLAEEAADDELVSASGELAAAEGLEALPAACAALVGLRRALARGDLAPARHVVVLTG
jgi:threonine synthase